MMKEYGVLNGQIIKYGVIMPGILGGGLGLNIIGKGIGYAMHKIAPKTFNKDFSLNFGNGGLYLISATIDLLNIYNIIK